jgi:Cellulase (glycosyl hydrolase family 5)
VRWSLLPLLLLALAAPAHAASPEIGIADDRILMSGGPTADRAVAEWRDMGVDTVRIFALWSQIAPASKPGGFRSADPNDPHYRWFYVDDAIERVRAAGMSVTLTVTGPGPAWTSSAPRRGQGQWKPRPSAYAAFAAAVAKRYASRVDRYILWNEPNIWVWLSPQARCRRGRCTPMAPHLYRRLVRAAYPAIADNDPVSEIVIGALSPRGQRLRNTRTVMRPLLFLRRLGCRTDAWQRMTTGECRGFKPATGDGFAIHPYSGRLAPELRHPNADDVGLAQIRTLSATLDRLQRARALRATTRRFQIFIDEYGYQTSPPDRIAGVKPQTQDAWLQRAAYLAFRTPRIRLFTQYLWRDEPRSPDGSFSGWQSGLRFVGGRPKPSLAHFDTPFVLDARNRRLWGQVRPGGAHTVTVERKPKTGVWSTFAVTRTNARGYWTLRRPLTQGASYRYRADGRVSATLRP